MSEGGDEILSRKRAMDYSAQSDFISNYDQLFLANSDYPSAQLTSIHFTGVNFFNWSRALKFALGAKSKQGFVNGTCVRPDKSSKDYDRWIKAGFMVRCWILNSMAGDIAEGFMYVESSKELWDELHERKY